MSTRFGSTSPVLNRLTVCRAAELARAGYYQEAEQLLRDAAAADPADPSVFDLLARALAQQGRMNEAAACWTKALQMDPGNPAYRDGLAQIKRTHLRFHVPPAWMFLLLIGLVAFLSVLYALNRIEERQLQTALAIQQLAVPPLELKLDVPGTRTAANRLTFDSGLFKVGESTLTPEGDKAVALVGERLRSRTDLRICIVGFSAGGSAEADHVKIGLDRAVAVGRRLSLPSERVSFRSLGARDLPHADLDKNQTVAIELSSAVK